MRTSYTINVETYSCKITVIITDELKSQAKKVYIKHNLKYVDDGESEGLMLNIDIDKYYLFIDLKYLSYNTIAHEVHHLVISITNERNIKDEEAQAWLAGYITAQIYKFLDKKKLKVKHG